MAFAESLISTVKMAAAAKKAKKTKAQKVKPVLTQADIDEINNTIMYLRAAEENLIQASKSIKHKSGKQLASNMSRFAGMLADKVAKVGLGFNSTAIGMIKKG